MGGLGSLSGGVHLLHFPTLTPTQHASLLSLSLSFHCFYTVCQQLLFFASLKCTCILRLLPLPLAPMPRPPLVAEAPSPGSPALCVCQMWLLQTQLSVSPVCTTISSTGAPLAPSGPVTKTLFYVALPTLL